MNVDFVLIELLFSSAVESAYANDDVVHRSRKGALPDKALEFAIRSPTGCKRQPFSLKSQRPVTTVKSNKEIASSSKSLHRRRRWGCIE